MLMQVGEEEEEEVDVGVVDEVKIPDAGVLCPLMQEELLSMEMDPCPILVFFSFVFFHLLLLEVYHDDEHDKKG
jgi:hypothetical protein